MMRWPFTLLYPARQEPVLTDAQRPEEVSADRWAQPLSEPPRRSQAKIYAVALIASGLVSPPVHETLPPTEVTVDSWLAPLSEPVRRKGPHAVYQPFAIIDPTALTQAETVSVDRWLSPLSEPSRYRQLPASLAPSSGLEYEVTAPIEEISADKWYQALSEPVRIPAALPAALQQSLSVDPSALALAEEVSVDRWLQPLAEPYFEKARLVEYGLTAWPSEFTTVAEPVTVDRWHIGLSEPRDERKRKAGYEIARIASGEFAGTNSAALDPIGYIKVTWARVCSAFEDGGAEAETPDLETPEVAAPPVHERHRWLVETGHIDDFGDSAIHDLRVTIKRGIGSNEAEPRLRLRINRDNKGYGRVIRRGLGRKGARVMDVNFGPLGSANTWQFEFSCTEDCEIELESMAALVTPLGH